MKRFLVGMMVLLVLGCVAAAGVVVYAYQQQNAAGPLAQEKVVLIAPGTGFKAIAAQLAREGVVGEKHLFMLPVLIEKQHRNVKAGEYLFPAGISGAAVMDKLIKGEVMVHAITVPEGLTVREVLALVAAEESLTGEVPTGIAEGTLLPETYQFIRGDSRAKIVDTMADAQEKVLNAAWDARQEGLPLVSASEALVLASIVEKETGVASERELVAGVYVNRLRIGMMLQADPTVAYGVMVEDGTMERALTRADLQRDTPYNTYTRVGLPPTPIACPGAAAIRATLNPASTEAIYFVATGTGGHAFSKTLEEHNRNVAAYRAVLREQR